MTTIVAPLQTSSIDDAAIIKKACLGFGTDEKAIISVLGRRNATQIKEIRKAYMEIYQEDLIQQLKSELSGSFEKAICLWVLDRNDRDAVIVYEAIKKSPPEYNTVLEIASTRTPDELLAVKRAYHLRYKRSLEEDLATCLTNKIGRFVLAMASVYKYDGVEVDESMACHEAKILNDEIQNLDSDHGEIIRIMSTRSKQQLRTIFSRFKDSYGTAISKSLQGFQGNEFLALLRVAIRAIENPPRYFAKALRSAIRGLGTGEDTLSRVIITRAEIDLQEIKNAYLKRTGESLDGAVARDTSGDYKDFLMALLGN